MSTHSVPSYDTFLSTFRVEDLASQFAGNLQTGLNVCFECCDRWAAIDPARELGMQRVLERGLAFRQGAGSR